MGIQKSVSARIFADDVKEILTDVKAEYIRHHPEMKHIRLSIPFLVNKMKNFYLGRN